LHLLAVGQNQKLISINETLG